MSEDKKHVPLPWEECARLDGGINIITYGATKIAEMPSDHPDEEEKANAEFIIRACNNHYKMLNALKEAHDALIMAEACNGAPYKYTERWPHITDAIAKAEGK